MTILYIILEDKIRMTKRKFNNLVIEMSILLSIVFIMVGIILGKIFFF